MRIRSRVAPYWALAAAVAAFAAYRWVTIGEWLGWAVTAAALALAIAHLGECIEVTGPVLRHRYAWRWREVDLREVTHVWMTPRHRSLFCKLMLFDGRRATCLGPVERWAEHDWSALSAAMAPWLEGRDGCRVDDGAARALRWGEFGPELPGGDAGWG